MGICNGKPTVALLLNKGIAQKLIRDNELAYLKEFACIREIDSLPEKVDDDYIHAVLGGAIACITSWGTPRLTEDMIERAVNLKLIAHAAGSVQHLLPGNIWGRGIRVTSSAPVIAMDVAETVLGLIIISLRKILFLNSICSRGSWWSEERESPLIKPMYGSTIGIIGASLVGRNVIKLLRPFELKVLLYDPYISPQQALELGAVKVSLEELMAQSDLVSLHAPETKETYHLINKGNLSLMKDGATFINTARGSLVDEAALINELQTGRISACIDVTDPEPPHIDSPLRSMKNVLLTPHIAGVCAVNGHQPLGRYIVKQIHNFLMTGILDYEITKERLNILA